MKSWWSKCWPPFVAVLFLLTIWQLCTTFFDIEQWILPSPYAIAQEASSQSVGLWKHTLATIQLTVVGFIIGTLVGLLIAIVLHMTPFLKSALYPLLILSQNVPTIALAPLLMIWFGFGLLPKIIVITLVCFFPVSLAMMGGLKQTDSTMLSYMRMIGANKRQIFVKLELPHSLPSLFSGIKIAATYSVMGAVIAEWIGSDKGIGYYMMLQKASYRTDRMFVAIAIIVVLSLIMFSLIALLEKWTVRWTPQQEK
ncbi:ABC transporter permease [Paenibacillus crassostreae]|uniref:Nitrate ABC transporter permease n=1 Tax=Paenibacillus crassostreae TaxID=1763538 RepID=A0A167BU99_9BACL|nr:ABC transporter permease [Paenibacillus crassostreae]AOZ92502.1 nitrate ABC transporter permease [Paenibacillus crassostreae]OAB72451.1 nitrate ABC transporter permease [Paenibacillus crassostreae]